MKIWICIPVHNRIEFTLNCLKTLYRQTFKEFSVVLCDDGSTDGTAEQVSSNYSQTILLSGNGNLWWTGAINCCVSFVLQHGNVEDAVLTLNNDTELPPDYLAQLNACSQRYANTVITSVIYDIKTGKLASIGYRQNWLTAKAKSVSFENDHIPDDDNVIEVTHASGRGTLFPLTAFRRVGLYNQERLPHYGADYDFSHKVRRAGFPIYVSSKCKVLSHVDATGMNTVRQSFSLNGLKDYLCSMKSPAKLSVRWWLGWNNCPRMIFPIYFLVDVVRIIGSYFRHFMPAIQPRKKQSEP